MIPSRTEQGAYFKHAPTIDSCNFNVLHFTILPQSFRHVPLVFASDYWRASTSRVRQKKSILWRGRIIQFSTAEQDGCWICNEEIFSNRLVFYHLFHLNGDQYSHGFPQIQHLNGQIAEQCRPISKTCYNTKVVNDTQHRV